ncbi:MAG TPA: helix-turn-helix domain-containing protein, partial [Solirubrobacteraceae bacterium]|nr:helix-turn-helix domain-containing protein [Solirubrobacteraceae bacterium]
MLSQRHTPTTEHDALLDAARECVLAVGVRRTTLTDVARRAGVSRMTLYRRYPDLEGVLSSLMTREFGRLVAEAAARAEGANTRERV